VGPSESSGGGRRRSGLSDPLRTDERLCRQYYGLRRLDFSFGCLCRVWRKPYTQRVSVCSAQSPMSPIRGGEGLQEAET